MTALIAFCLFAAFPLATIALALLMGRDENPSSHREPTGSPYLVTSSDHTHRAALEAGVMTSALVVSMVNMNVR